MMLQICKEQRAASAAQLSGHMTLKATVQPGASTEAKQGRGLAGVSLGGGWGCPAGRGARGLLAGRLGLEAGPWGLTKPLSAT